MCTEYEFYISAISVSSKQLPTFNVTGWTNPSSKNRELFISVRFSPLFEWLL